MTIAEIGRRTTWLALGALALLAVACGEDDGGFVDDTPADASGAGVYVLNEGGFGQGNASLSFYDAVTGELTESVFATANGRALAPTANDIVLRDNQLWIVVNNSETVEVLAVGTHLLAGTVTFAAGSSPTTIAFDGATGKGYVPLRFGNALARIDPVSFQQDGILEVGTNPQEAVVSDGKVYVTDSGFGSGTTVTVVDTATFTISSIIEVGTNPTAIVAPDNGKIVVLASGVTWDNPDTPEDDRTPGAIVVIDAASGTVTNSIPLDSGAADRMELGVNGVAYFLTFGAVASFDTNSESLQPELISAAAHGAAGFYGLSVNPSSGLIYVTDAKDYTTAGDVYVFEPTGALVRKFTADLLPRAMAFVGDASGADLIY